MRLCFETGPFVVVALLFGCTSEGSSNQASGGAGGEGGAGILASFQDVGADFETSEVHDVDRQVVHFDVGTSSMVWADGTRVSGWTTDGNDLSWARSGVAFRVRFGSEAGERRAYFTETATGTICDLNISAPDQMTIFSTNQVPPQE